MKDMPDYARDIIKDMPDWRVVQAEDIDAQGNALAPTGVWFVLLEYTVPLGKMLLIYDWSVAMGVAGDMAGQMVNATAALYISYGGGAQGFQTPFNKPKRITAGQKVQVYGIQNTGAQQTMYGHFGGILI